MLGMGYNGAVASLNKSAKTRISEAAFLLKWTSSDGWRFFFQELGEEAAVHAIAEMKIACERTAGDTDSPTRSAA